MNNPESLCQDDFGTQQAEQPTTSAIPLLENEVSMASPPRDRHLEDLTREQLEAAVMDAQRQAELAEQQKEDALKKATEWETRAEELNAKATSLSQQVEELQTTIRSRNSQESLEQKIVNKLRDNARQNERNYWEMAENYKRVLEENTTLLARLSDMAALRVSSQGPFSLPNFGDNSSTVQRLDKKIEEQEAEIGKLTNINVRWQEHDKKRVAQMNKLKEKYEKEIAELRAEIRGFTNSNQAVVFNEVQQERVDNYLQRLRRREDETREQLEAAVMDAQRQAEVAKQQMEDASRKATEQETRAEELNAKAASLSQQVEELRAALVVATRRHNSDQQTINHLREKIRQDEQKYLEITEDYRRLGEEIPLLNALLSVVIAENNRLIRQVRSFSSPATP